MFEYKPIESYLSKVTAKSFLPLELFGIDRDIIKLASLNFIEDYKRWFADADCFEELKLHTTPQLVAVLCYRISHYINQLPPPIDLKYKPDTYSILGREIGQIEIFYSSNIGTGFKINHGVGTVIGARCNIGTNCTIHQNCTIGDRHGGRPTIGNNVTIYAGSMVLGDIHIGDNSIIGANSVVTKSCPEGSVLIGTPAKIIKTLL